MSTAKDVDDKFHKLEQRPILPWLVINDIPGAEAPYPGLPTAYQRAFATARTLISFR